MIWNGQPCVKTTVFIKHSEAKIPFTVISGVASTYLEKVSQKINTHWFKFSLRGKWKTSEHTTSQGLVGMGLDNVEGLILKCPTGFFFLWHSSHF